MSETDPHQTFNLVICPQCKAEFVCMANDPTQACWCTKLPPVRISIDDKGEGKCFCKECLDGMVTVTETLSK